MEKLAIDPSLSGIQLTDVFAIAMHHRFQWEEEHFHFPSFYKIEKDKSAMPYQESLE